MTQLQTPANIELLRVRQVAEMLGVSERHVWRLAETEKMPAPVRLGQLRRWRRSEIAKWLDGGCRPVGPE